jgi:hypothetical protein
MENEVKEKQELKKSSIVSMSLNGIPRSVHNKILKYRTDIIGKYRKPLQCKGGLCRVFERAVKSNSLNDSDYERLQTSIP